MCNLYKWRVALNFIEKTIFIEKIIYFRIFKDLHQK